VFSPLTPSEVVAAIGRAAREAASGSGPTSEFSRGQLMSAFSASRHLSVELACFPDELRGFTEQLAPALRDTAELDAHRQLVALAGELERASDAARIGDLVSEALALVRTDGAPTAGVLRRRIRAALRALSEREVELLADAIEGPVSR
jgi:hypothetical protein